jgi:hypothetical protein
MRRLHLRANVCMRHGFAFVDALNGALAACQSRLALPNVDWCEPHVN